MNYHNEVETDEDERILSPKVQKHLTTLYLGKTPIPQLFGLITKNIKHEFDSDLQDEFADCTFAHRLARRYPLSHKYRLAFIKALIQLIESQSQEVTEIVYSEYTTLLAQPTSSSFESQDECYFVTRLIHEKYVVTKQSDAIVSEGTTGLRFWEGGLQLFEQMFANRRLLKDKKVLELGAGNGFAGIAVSKFCELNGYIFTDHHYRVFQLLKENLALNGFHSSDLIPTDRRRNKFYETEDEEGNRSIKYYDRDETKKEKPFECITSKNSTSYFLDKGGRFVDKSNSSTGSSSSADQVLIEQSMQFDRKLQDLNEKMTSFEDFLESFKEKLTIMDEKWNTMSETLANKNKWDWPNSLGKSDSDTEDVLVSSIDAYDETNQNLNKNVIVCELDWTLSEAEIQAKFEEHTPDYVVGADIVFDPELIPELVKVLRVALNVLPKLKIILICSVRNEETLEKFDDQLTQLERYHGVEFIRTDLAPRFTIFKHLPCAQPFALYSIQNAKEKNDDFCL